MHPELQSWHWYVLIAGAAASAHRSAEAIPLLYEMAIDEHAPRGSREHDQEAIMFQCRLKEALLKGSVLFGIATSLDGIFPLIPLLRRDAERDPGRNDAGFTLQDGQTIVGSAQRRTEQMALVYQHNLDEIIRRMGTETGDLKTLTIDINYGWNLSENRILDFPATELLIFAALVVKNLRAVTLWHLHGSRRAGWNDDVIESVRTTSVQLATQAGLRTDRVPSLHEVRDDTNELDGK